MSSGPKPIRPTAQLIFRIAGNSAIQEANFEYNVWSFRLLNFGTGSSMATTESPRARFRAFRKSFRTTPARYEKDNAVTLCREKHDDTSSGNSEDGVLAGALSRSIILPKEQLSVLTPVVGPTLNLQISKIGVSPPKPGEVVVRIAWTGLCGSVSCSDTIVLRALTSLP